MSISVPDDFNRVIFRLDIEGNQTSDPEDEEEYSSDEEEESNQYINASFIDVQNLILLKTKTKKMNYSYKSEWEIV